MASDSLSAMASHICSGVLLLHRILRISAMSSASAPPSNRPVKSPPITGALPAYANQFRPLAAGSSLANLPTTGSMYRARIYTSPVSVSLGCPSEPTNACLLLGVPFVLRAVPYTSYVRLAVMLPDGSISARTDPRPS